MSAPRFGCFWLLIIPLISVEALHNPGLTSSERRSSQSGLIAIFGNDNITGFHMNSTWKSNNTKDWGEWSPWSPWTPCSTSCGLGITKQTRQCIRKSSNVKRNVFYKRQRLKRVSDVDTRCRGPADETRYHVCNKQLCPNNTDFRETQCSSFNEKLFNGQKYAWSAYYHAANLCALNCRAIGYRFYATLKPKVMDGTPCNNGTNDSTPYVCVEGQCKILPPGYTKHLFTPENVLGIVWFTDDDRATNWSAALTPPTNHQISVDYVSVVDHKSFCA